MGAPDALQGRPLHARHEWGIVATIHAVCAVCVISLCFLQLNEWVEDTFKWRTHALNFTASILILLWVLDSSIVINGDVDWRLRLLFEYIIQVILVCTGVYIVHAILVARYTSMRATPPGWIKLLVNVTYFTTLLVHVTSYIVACHEDQIQYTLMATVLTTILFASYASAGVYFLSSIGMELAYVLNRRKDSFGSLPDFFSQRARRMKAEIVGYTGVLKKIRSVLWMWSIEIIIGIVLLTFEIYSTSSNPTKKISDLNAGLYQGMGVGQVVQPLAFMMIVLGYIVYAWVPVRKYTPADRRGYYQSTTRDLGKSMDVSSLAFEDDYSPTPRTRQGTSIEQVEERRRLLDSKRQFQPIRKSSTKPKVLVGAAQTPFALAQGTRKRGKVVEINLENSMDMKGEDSVKVEDMKGEESVKEESAAIVGVATAISSKDKKTSPVKKKKSPKDKPHPFERNDTEIRISVEEPPDSEPKKAKDTIAVPVAQAKGSDPKPFLMRGVNVLGDIILKKASDKSPEIYLSPKEGLLEALGKVPVGSEGCILSGADKKAKRVKLFDMALALRDIAPRLVDGKEVPNKPVEIYSNPLDVFEEKDRNSISHLCSILAKPHNSFVALRSKGKVHAISRKDMVHTIYKSGDDLSDLFQKKISDLGFTDNLNGIDPTIKSSEPVASAFSKLNGLIQKGWIHHALAVVDNGGNLTTDFTLPHIRGLACGPIPLNETVGDYILRVDKQKRTPYVVGGFTTFLVAVEKLFKSEWVCAWVLDGHRIVGCVSYASATEACGKHKPRQMSFNSQMRMRLLAEAHAEIRSDSHSRPRI